MSRYFPRGYELKLRDLCSNHLPRSVIFFTRDGVDFVQ